MQVELPVRTNIDISLESLKRTVVSRRQVPELKLLAAAILVCLTEVVVMFAIERLVTFLSQVLLCSALLHLRARLSAKSTSFCFQSSAALQPEIQRSHQRQDSQRTDYLHSSRAPGVGM